jgi:hypothetical protein
MKAGHSYRVEVVVPSLTGPDGTAQLRARERNAEGDVTAEFGPISSQAEIEECLALARLQ